MGQSVASSPQVHRVHWSTESTESTGQQVHGVHRSTESTGPRSPQVHRVHRSTGGLWTVDCGLFVLEERTYFLILFGLLPFEIMSVIPPFGNNLDKLCIETEVIYSTVMTYTVLRYLQKQPNLSTHFSHS